MPRAATDADRAFCWRLHVATLRAHVEATWGRWDEDDQKARFAAWFEPAKLRIVEIDGAPVGFLKVEVDDARVRLLSIAIAPAHQRRGLGTRLVADLLREAGTRPVWLQVLKVNPARALYERLGFEVSGETATHWQMTARGRMQRDASG